MKFWFEDDFLTDVQSLDGQSGNECIHQCLVGSSGNECQQLEEDQIATDASLQVVGRPTSNMLQYENIEQEIYTCAAGENSTPHYMLMDDTFEELTFPDMFPYGLLWIFYKCFP